MLYGISWHISRHYIRNYWYEVGTEFDECGTNFDELGTKDIPEVIHPLAALRAVEGCISQ